ncbi:MAG: hypothetical protein K5798_10515 [Nitrosopumilus sp.]|uniref:hypothetical protein n=1 Tax=Nitrosopumilus sp. TaxID=2024843 RepID=UPI00242CB9FC|nr:hypothetical protein [Nitrosopumilus sp.]MCV0367678.1 hypothetical protein [Nitrosopumilus sp.]
MKTIILTLIPVLTFLGILGIVILFGNWSQPQPELGGNAIDVFFIFDAKPTKNFSMIG